jgi:hypothetical protein
MPFQPPHRSRRLLLGGLLSALAWCLVLPPPGQAGAYRITYDFGSDLSGWSAYVEPGWMDCSRVTPAGCPDLSTLRVMAKPGAARADWSQGRWEWTAPPGSVIASGALTYRVRTGDAGVTARVKVKNEDVPWSSATTLANDVHYPTLTTLVAALPGGYRQLGVALSAHPAMATGSVTDAWADYVTLQSLDVIVQEDGAPTVAWADGGGLLDGAWHHGEPMCARVHAEDATAGVAHVSVSSSGMSHDWSAPPTGSVYRPAPGAADPVLCLSGGEVGDGVHGGAIGVRDAAGNDGAALPFVVRVDTVPPTAAFSGPGPSTSDRRPLLTLDVQDATSGVASATLSLDGVPLAGGSGRLSARPDADLGFGRHVVAWRVVDVSGLATEGSAIFDVLDTTPPVIGGLHPADGETTSTLRPMVGFVARDDGSGVDPARLSLTLDGAPVSLAWDDAGSAGGQLPPISLPAATSSRPSQPTGRGTSPTDPGASLWLRPPGPAPRARRLPADRLPPRRRPPSITPPRARPCASSACGRRAAGAGGCASTSVSVRSGSAGPLPAWRCASASGHAGGSRRWSGAPTAVGRHGSIARVPPRCASKRPPDGRRSRWSSRRCASWSGCMPPRRGPGPARRSASAGIRP